MLLWAGYIAVSGPKSLLLSEKAEPRLITENAVLLDCAGLASLSRVKREGARMNSSVNDVTYRGLVKSHVARLENRLLTGLEKHGYKIGRKRDDWRIEDDVEFVRRQYDHTLLSKAANNILKEKKKQLMPWAKLAVQIPRLWDSVYKDQPTWELVDILARAVSIAPTRGALSFTKASQATTGPRPNSLNALLALIKADHPEYSWKEAARDLEKKVGNGIIMSMDDKLIVWQGNNRLHRAKCTGLAARWSRSR